LQEVEGCDAEYSCKRAGSLLGVTVEIPERMPWPVAKEVLEEA
jgi:hypothetical protein